MSHTNSVGLNLDAILHMSLAGVISILVDKDSLSAESVDEGSSACNVTRKFVVSKMTFRFEGGRLRARDEM